MRESSLFPVLATMRDATSVALNAMRIHLGCRSWDLSELSELWWYHTDAENAAKEAPVLDREPKEVFERRMAELIEYIQARPEQTLALVCHWGVIVSITGEDFDNCEMRKFNVRALKPLSVFAE